MKNDFYYLNCITFGRAAEGLRADFQKQLVCLQKEIGFKYVRFHGLFHDDMAVYREENGAPILWFGYVDKLFDFLLENGLKPFVELGFMPSALATVKDTVFWWHANGCPPIDYNKWHYLVEQTVKHFVERYGLSEVETWYFEVWNEPNLKSFWRGSKEEYFKLYEVSVDAVKSVGAPLRVGGPSVSGADFRENLGYLKSFIAFCKSKNLPVDFFTGHPYPTYWPLDTDGNERMGYMEKDIVTKFIDDIKVVVEKSAFKGAEIHLTEWNSSPSPRDLIHDTPFEAPYILYNVTQNIGKVDSLGFWTFTDVFEENGPGEYPFHGGFGLMNADGIKKPSYWAYFFLKMLGGDIIERTKDYIITKQGDDYAIAVWNLCFYKDEFAKGDRSKLSLTQRDEVFVREEKTVSVSVSLKGKYEQYEYTLDEETSALHNWIRAGAHKYPTKKLIEEIDEKSRPKISRSFVDKFDKNILLKPHEVKFYILKTDK